MGQTASNLDRAPGPAGGVLAAGVPVGSVAGVELRLHWTCLIAGTAITVVLVGGVFPDAAPGFSDATYLGMGLVTALLIFASLVLHELGHALEARRNGMPTRVITLWMLGGVRGSSGPFPSAASEARVALAGPAVSAALCAALVAVGQIGGLPNSVAAVFESLAWANVLLLAFSMIPAVPLDGGRVLHAVLWGRSGDLPSATRVASRVSQAIAALLIVLGFAAVLAGLAIGGLWLIWIGWFTFADATAERGAAEAQVALTGVQVADAMTPDPITIRSTASAAELLDMSRRTGHAVYPVTDASGDAIGLVSAVAAQAVLERRRLWVTVRELLSETAAPLAFDADTELVSAVPALVDDPLHCAAVLRAGRLVGLLSLADVGHAVHARTGTGSP